MKNNINTMKKIIPSIFILSLILILSVGIASAQTLVAGKIYKANTNYSETISNANITVCCDDLPCLDTTSLSDGVYAVVFGVDSCGIVSVTSDTNNSQIMHIIRFIPDDESTNDNTHHSSSGSSNRFYLCGNGICDSGETANTCSKDCAIEGTHLVSTWQFKNGFLKTLKKGDKMIFDFGDEFHSVTILNVDYDRVEFVINSEPQYAILGKGELKSFDLNDDDVFDLLVKVENISNGLATIKIQSLNENSEKDNTIDLGFSSTEPDKNDEGFLSSITGAVTGVLGTAGSIIMVVFIVGIVGAFTFVKIRKRK